MQYTWHTHTKTQHILYIHILTYTSTCIQKVCRSLKTSTHRAHTDLNHGPADLQSAALPLSYTPAVTFIQPTTNTLLIHTAFWRTTLTPPLRIDYHTRRHTHTHDGVPPLSYRSCQHITASLTSLLSRFYIHIYVYIYQVIHIHIRSCRHGTTHTLCLTHTHSYTYICTYRLTYTYANNMRIPTYTYTFVLIHVNSLGHSSRYIHIHTHTTTCLHIHLHTYNHFDIRTHNQPSYTYIHTYILIYPYTSVTNGHIHKHYTQHTHISYTHTNHSQTNSYMNIIRNTHIYIIHTYIDTPEHTLTYTCIYIYTVTHS